MLKLAIKSGLPLIAVKTKDTMNIKAVIKSLVDKEAAELTQGILKTTNMHNVEGKLFLAFKGNVDLSDLNAVYNRMVNSDSTIIIVNPKEIPDQVFDAGVMPVPKEMVHEFLSNVMAPEVVEAIMPTLGGITMREIAEIVRLTSTRDGCLTPRGIMATRREYLTPEQGLSIVDTALVAYLPNPDLVDYAESRKHFFLDPPNPLLMPRGLLADGRPGTGKTQGARYLANFWGVPLFRLDMTVQSKYVGESEGNMADALSQISNEAPCILLFDEVEKMFSHSGGGDTGVTLRLLGQLLWFLQEHTSQVYAFMTTNNKKALPPELYREGRVDKEMTFDGADKAKAFLMMEVLIDSMGLADKVDLSPIIEVIEKFYGVGNVRSEAEVKGWVCEELIKQL